MRATAVVGWLIPLVFLGLAALLAANRDGPEIPVAPIRVVDPATFAPVPWRAAKTEPQYLIAGLELRCSACHDLFESRPFISAERLVQHTDIEFDHGTNNVCFNCHDNADRNRLRLVTGELIEFSEAVRLCAQCHGPLYRDWQRGIHGKKLGSWQDGRGERLACTQCHDPHAPAFAPMSLLPGPRTLRMGRQSAHPHPTMEPHRPLIDGAERATREADIEAAEGPAEPVVGQDEGGGH
jgi:hypothetical protein